MGNDEAKVIETNNKATLFYSGGEKYEGEILEGKRHGFGTYFYQTGDRYTGMWEQNMKHGRGTMFYANEEVYEGWWNNNLREGVGTLFYQNGERYYGEWKNNKKCGQGFIHATDGSKYIGQFKNNKKDGVGEIIGIGKEKITEEWRDGKLHKRHDKTKSIKEEKDYVKLDTDQLQRYLDSKMIQSEKNKKYLSLEIAKVIRSKNIDVNLENRKALNNEFLTNNPDLTSWTVQEVVEWFKNFELEKYESVIKQENIDGNKLNLMELNNLLKILKPEEKKDFNNITFSFEILKKIKKEDPLKSIRSFKSIGIDKKHLTSIKDLKSTSKILFESIQEEGFEENEKNNFSHKENFPSLSENNKVAKKKEYYSPSQTISSSVNLNGLSYYINFDELSLQTKVGEGGFGEVFLGHWGGKKIAVKKLSMKHHRNRENICRFINEINVISSLRHPNIVLYIGASINKDDYYMITEYLPRGSLFDYMRKVKNKFTEREQINIAYEMAVALNYLHSRFVVHCDLKSSNILIDDNWKIKIGDFGLSQFIKENEYNRGKIGTVHWMAPEILKGGIYEYSSDVYSFGMILWEILNMEIPYYGLNPYQIQNLVVQDKKIVEIPREGHEVLIDILKNCLEYEPHKRPSLKDIVAKLEKLKNYNKNIDTNFEELYHFLF